MVVAQTMWCRNNGRLDHPRSAEKGAHQMQEKTNLSELQARLHEALVKVDSGVADIYLGLVFSLQETALHDRQGVIGYEARELMNQVALRLALPGEVLSGRPQSLAAMVEELGTRYGTLEHELAAAVPEADTQGDPTPTFLEYLRNWLDRVAQQHPAKRELVRHFARRLDPAHTTPHGKRFELIFTRWSSLEDFFNSLLHHRAISSEGRLQQAVAELEDFLIHRVSPPTFSDRNTLETYLTRDPGSLSAEEADRLLALLEALDVNHRFFFTSLDSPNWIGFLETHGFFGQPVPIETLGDRVLAADWPELGYLERVAARAPDAVATIALRVARGHPENPRIHVTLLGIARNLFQAAPKLANKLLSEELEWTREQTYLHYPLPSKLLEAAVAAASSHSSRTALRVARGLLSLEVSEATAQSLSEQTWTRMDRWEFEGILRAVVKDLLPVMDRPTQLCFLSTLFELLSLLAKYELGDMSPAVLTFHCLLWWPAIEEHHQNSPDAVCGWIVRAVRDAAELMLTAHGQAVLEALEGQKSVTLARIALYLRGQHPALDPQGTAALIADPNVLDNIHLRHELFGLLAASFGVLDSTQQDLYLQHVARQTTPQEKQLYLWPVRQSLPPAWADVYSELEEQLGPPEHPDFPIYRETSWVGPTSPYSADEMQGMSPEQLVGVLNAWQYTGGSDQPEPEGLARELAVFATRDAAGLSNSAKVLETLKQPTCVRGIAQGFGDAVKAGHPISWEPVLDFCKWAVDQPRGEGCEGSGLEAFDRTWGPARKQIAWLLLHGTKKTPAEIPIALRQKIWPILAELATDPDPTDEAEAARAEYEDPATTSINTVRGVALGGVLSYALWVIRHGEVETRSWARLDLTEVECALDGRLARDPSAAVHAVLGKWFSFLFWADEAWTHAHAERIFPRAEGTEKLWRAAWEAYLALGSTIYLDAFPLLRPSYERALAEIGAEPPKRPRLADPGERLGGHLMLFYREGVLGMADPLLSGFFANADAKLRYSALIDAVGQLQRIPEGRRAAVVKRLEELWEWRCAASIDEGNGEHQELSAFSWWLPQDDFAPEWSLRQLAVTQQHHIKLDLDGRVLDCLAALADSLPAQVVDCLDAIVRNPANDSWGVYDDRAKEILRAILDLPDDALQNRARRVADYIGSLGYGGFSELAGR